MLSPKILALHEMLIELFGVKTNPRSNPITTTVATSVTKILANDPMRLSLVIFNLGANSVFVAPDNLVSASRGIYLAPNGGSVSLIWDTDFELCSRDWYAIASGASSTIYVLENRSY